MIAAVNADGIINIYAYIFLQFWCQTSAKHNPLKLELPKDDNNSKTATLCGFKSATLLECFLSVNNSIGSSPAHNNSIYTQLKSKFFNFILFMSFSSNISVKGLKY